MADNEEKEENTSRGNDWEVVSLTASTYAAAPGPKEAELKDENKENAYGKNEAETSHALFMSGHFIFPPNEHENLLLEHDDSKTLNEQVGKNIASELVVEEGDKSCGKDEENWPLKGLNVSDVFARIPFFYEKGTGLSISGKEFEASTTLSELNINEKEQSIYSTSTFSSLHSETELGGSATYGENLSIHEVNEQSKQGLDFSTDISQSPKSDKDAKHVESDQAWWKRRAASLYSHAKETNAFWSIFVAAAVMGLVILGQRWQQERWRALQLKWQTSINEKNVRALGPISRLKDVMVGGNRRRSFVLGTSSSEN